LRDDGGDGRVRRGREGLLGLGATRTAARGLVPSACGVLRHVMLWRSLQWPHPTGGCAKIANGGRLIQGHILRTTRWAYAPKKNSSHSGCASRGIVAALTIRLASRPMPQGQVLPLRLQSRNAKAVQGRQIVVEASRRGAHTLQGGVRSQKTEVFRDTTPKPALWTGHSPAM
jgi:hypothetical protein